jgi:hypothetical protein
MAHASPEDIVAVRRDLATRDVLCLNSPGEKAVYLHIVLGHKRSAIVRAGVVETHVFKRALDAFNAGRMIGMAGKPGFLHTANEERLIGEIRTAQDAGKALSHDDIAEWVYSKFFFSFIFNSSLDSKTFGLYSTNKGTRS